MTTYHTPGPWETSVLSDGTQWQVCEPGAGDWIADCKNAEDARLIAAAPDLLAALESVRDYWSGGDCPPALWGQITQTIARAKGQA